MPDPWPSMSIASSRLPQKGMICALLYSLDLRHGFATLSELLAKCCNARLVVT
jgi:hypothetical protein